MTLHFRGPIFSEKCKTRVRSPNFGGSFPAPNRGFIREERDLFLSLVLVLFQNLLSGFKCCLPDKARSSALRCRMRPTQSGAISIETIHTTCMKQYSRICTGNENCVSAGNSQLYVAKGTNALMINIKASVSRCRRVYPRCFQAIRMKSTLTPSNVQTIGHGLITAVSGCEFMMNQAGITGTSPFISSVKTLKAIVKPICS